MDLRGGYRFILFLMAAVAAQSCADTPTPATGGSAGSTPTTSGPTTGTGSGPTSTTSSTSGGGSAGTTMATGGGAGTAVTTTAAGGAGGAGGDVGVGGSMAGMAGAGGTLPPYNPGDTPSALPFPVDNSFVASGYMGDGATPNAIVEDVTMACNATRPANAQGKCHKFTYTPVAVGGMGWGGVFWQYPANNWGVTPGKRIAPGATKITFNASGAKGGESVSFIVGLKGTNYADTISLTATFTLTTTMTAYSLDLTSLTYDAVLGAFGWTIAAPMAVGDAGAPATTFTVDNIRWE